MQVMPRLFIMHLFFARIGPFIFSWTRWPSSAGPSATRSVLCGSSDSSSATSCPWRSRGRRTRRPPRWSPSSGWWASGGCAASPASSPSPSSWRGKHRPVSPSERLHLNSSRFIMRLPLLSGSVSLIIKWNRVSHIFLWSDLRPYFFVTTGGCSCIRNCCENCSPCSCCIPHGSSWSSHSGRPTWK